MKDKIIKYLMITAALVWFFLIIILPLKGIIQETFKTGFIPVIKSFSEPASIHSFKLTAVITVIAVIINTVAGIIMALVFTRDNFRGKIFLENIVDLPFSVSPVVAGFMFILLFGPEGWLGKWFSTGGIKIVYALPGMVIATLFVTLPFVVREILPVLRECSREQEEAAYTLGADEWVCFRKVTLPSVKWGLAYGITLTIARSIGEFGAVLLVSGSIIGVTQTATLRIHDQFTNFNYTGAFGGAMALGFISFIIITFVNYLQKKKKGLVNAGYKSSKS